MCLREAARLFSERRASLSVLELLAPRVPADGPDADLLAAIRGVADRCRAAEITVEEARQEVAALLRVNRA